MKAIDFVVRGDAGDLQRGTIPGEGPIHTIVAGTGQEISINVGQSDLVGQTRAGDQLIITLNDGRTLTIDNFFSDAGPANRLFISADGYLNEVSFVEADTGALYAQYGPTTEWGKWSPSDDLIFLGDPQVAGVPLSGQEDVSMLGAALLGGGSLLGGGAAVAAGLGSAALLGGAGGGGGEPRAPFVDEADASVIVGGDDADNEIVITGGGETGEDVTVIIGDKTVETKIKKDGTFKAVFEGDDFPADGSYEAVVTVINPDGEATELDGPSFVIDVTAPEITITEGTESTGDVFNASSFSSGIALAGTGEPGAALDVTIAGHTQSTIVDGSGDWTVNWPADTFQAGEYRSDITLVTTDAFGNSRSYTETLVVDTVASVTVDSASVAGDGVINAAERADGVTFQGTAQSGSSVEVTVGSTTQTVTAGSNGTWQATFTPAQITSGEYQGVVSVQATDVHGNIANTSGSFDVDTFVRDFGITSSTGGDDGVINAQEADAPLVVTGTGEPDATVVIALAGATQNAVVAADGSWQAEFAAGTIAAGSYTTTMTATATDAAVNTDMASLQVRVDTEAGVLTIDGAPVEGDDIVNEVEASDGVVLSGTADAGAAVAVTLEGITRTVVADGDGTWEAFFSANDVAPGVYTAEITATTTDAYGNARSVSDSVEVDTQVAPFDITETGGGADGIVNADEAAAGIDLGGQVEAGSRVSVVFDGTAYTADVDAAGNWSLTVPGAQVRGGAYAAQIAVEATDAAGNVATISDTLSIDTDAPDGPVIASFTRGGDGIRGISIETVMENGAPTGDTQSVVQVAADGSIGEVGGRQGYNDLRGETDFVFDDNVPNGSQLIVNATDQAGNTSGTYLVLDDEAATNSVDLSNLALGDYQIENLDLDFAEAASVVIDEASLLALSTDSNTLTIHGSAEDQVRIANGTLQGTQDVDGQTYNVYAVGAEGTLLIDPEIPVTI